MGQANRSSFTSHAIICLGELTFHMLRASCHRVLIVISPHDFYTLHDIARYDCPCFPGLTASARQSPLCHLVSLNRPPNNGGVRALSAQGVREAVRSACTSKTWPVRVQPLYILSAIPNRPLHQREAPASPYEAPVAAMGSQLKTGPTAAPTLT